MAVDWEGLWQERRGLILMIAGAVVVALLGESLIHSFFSRPLARNQREIVRARRRLRSPAPAAEDVATAEREATRLEASVEALRGKLLFHVREAFTLPEGDPHPAVRYVDTVDRTLEALRSLARRQGVSIPDSLGLPQVAPSEESRVAGLLAALDGIERAVRRGVESALDEIESVRIVDEVPRVAKKGPEIGMQEVKILANGPAPALFDWMQALREEGIGFGPGRVEDVPRKESVLRAELTLRLLTEAHPVEESGEGEARS